MERFHTCAYPRVIGIDGHGICHDVRRRGWKTILQRERRGRAGLQRLRHSEGRLIRHGRVELAIDRAVVEDSVAARTVVWLRPLNHFPGGCHAIPTRGDQLL